MSDSNSTAPSKPSKPSPDFPLFPHATGRWAKKIHGKMVYFGPWDDPQGALKRYRDFAAGKTPKKRKHGKPKPADPDRPSKPYPEFPLFAHATKRWAKKIRGQLVYFGPWGNPDAALAKYLEQKDALHSGRKPRNDPAALTVKALVNEFLNHKQSLRDSSELSPRTWGEYKETCDLLVKQFGKTRMVSDLAPDDFAALRKDMAKRWGPTRLGNVIQRVRSVFKFATDNDLIDRAIRYGQGFQRPSANTLRLHRASQGPKLFTADEIKKLIGAADVQFRAMFLLGINCGFGIADCGRLPLSALDFETGWANFPRVKTGVPRRCPLWAETVEAIKEALAHRREPKQPEHEGLVFLTAQGQCWHKDDASSPAVFKVGNLLKALHINGRKGLGFYTLRHTFRTFADESKDQVAVDHIMGHVRDDMASMYRERISDERLRAVTDYVRAWLFDATGRIEAKE
jgi:integrase